MRSATALVVALVAVLGGASEAAAQPGSVGDAQAQRLFDEGRTLMEQRRYAEACAKFLASERVAASGGTLLNLADCYEKDGKTASAWARFKEVAARAAVAKRADIEAHALERAKNLEPRLSTLTVMVPPDSDVVGLVVRRGEESLDRGAWGTPLPVDPGGYDVAAAAPGRKTWSLHVTVAGGADRAVVTIPKLDADAAPAEPSTRDRAPGDSLPPASPPLSTQKTLGVALAAGGVVALGVGTFFGLRAKGKNDDALAHCPASPQCRDDQGPSLTREAESAATASTIAFIAGGALVAGGAVLWFTAPKANATVSASLTGVRLSGTFR